MAEHETLADHPHADPGDGRSECEWCGKWVWLVIHSCKGVPVTEAAIARYEADSAAWRAARLAALSAHLAPGAWPCANYTRPVTCLTAPSTETGRCDHCRSLAPGPVRAGDTSGEEGL